ncbi:MAG: FecR domain-containing protein [Deltaproteobacteria bacterium]|nr:FecR domain-containing protein [Deltaproteobacteria bacterium]
MEALLERVARANEPSCGAVERVVERVIAGERDPATSGLLDVLPRPREVASDRFAVLAPKPRVRPVRRRLAFGVALAFVLVAVGLAVRSAQTRPVLLDARLDSEVARSFDEIPEVDVTYVGRGDVTGSASHPFIFWEVGRLALCVPPGQGIHLTVRTPDGQAVVHGTCFRVERNALGTRVSVTEGRVEVTCGEAGAPVFVEGGDARECRPTRPAALLARALVLRKGGDAASALSALQEGLAHSTAGDPARGEMLALLVEIQVEAEDLPAALEAARIYLAEGHEPRRADMSELVRRLESKVSDTRGGSP